MSKTTQRGAADPERLRRAWTGLVLEVFRMNGDLLAAGDALVGDLGLTSARWQVLGAIALSPVPLPVAHIARNMGLTRQAVQRLVDEMRTDGLVRLEPNPHHRRAMLVVATERGDAAYRAASERQERWSDASPPDWPPTGSRPRATCCARCSGGSGRRTPPPSTRPRRKETDMPTVVEMDRTVTLAEQLSDDGGPVVRVNTVVVPPPEADRLLAARTADAGIMRRQPGFVSTRLHRGIAGGGVFLNTAARDGLAAVRAAFANPAFRARLSDAPASATASPPLFRTVAAPGLCAA